MISITYSPPKDVQTIDILDMPPFSFGRVVQGGTTQNTSLEPGDIVYQGNVGSYPICFSKIGREFRDEEIYVELLTEGTITIKLGF